MSIKIAKEYLETFGLAEKILEFPQSSATVELAAEAAGVIPARICKTITFYKDKKDSDAGAILVCAAGDIKIDNKKFKNRFGMKAKMLNPEHVLKYTNHDIGGVCPFGINEGTEVYCDESLKRFSTVFPACGSSNSAIEMTPDDFYRYSNSLDWVDLAKGGVNE